MIVETTLAMMTRKWGSEELRHDIWRGYEAHLAYMVAAFNILAQWHGLEPDARGGIHRSLVTSTSDTN